MEAKILAAAITTIIGFIIDALEDKAVSYIDLLSLTLAGIQIGQGIGIGAEILS